MLSSALRDQRVSFMDHLDLIFKWISLRLCEKENVKAMGQVGYALVACLGQSCEVYILSTAGPKCVCKRCDGFSSWADCGSLRKVAYPGIEGSE